MAKRDLDFDEDAPPAEEIEGRPKPPRQKEYVHEDERDLRGLPTAGPSAKTKTEETPMAVKAAYFVSAMCITFALFFKFFYDLNHP